MPFTEKNHKTMDTSDDERLILLFILILKKRKQRRNAVYGAMSILSYGPYVENPEELSGRSWTVWMRGYSHTRMTYDTYKELH